MSQELNSQAAAPEIVARFRSLVPVRTPDAIERALSDARTR